MSRRFLTPSKIPKYLFCIICSEVFDDPKRLTCGHTFCNNCISTWIKTSRTCPVCRRPCRKNNLGLDLIARNVVNDLEVICPNKGCPWTGKLADAVDHEKSCVFHPKKIAPCIADHIPEKNIDGEDDLEKPEESLISSLYIKYSDGIKKFFERRTSPKENLPKFFKFESSDEESDN